MATKVGYLYDPSHAEHDHRSHPENASRLAGTMDLLGRLRLTDALTQLPTMSATMDQLLLVHDPREVDLVKEAAARGRSLLDPDTYVAPGSFAAAVNAAGGTISCVDAVLTDQVTSAFALVRPPGHHATPIRPMGFCLFNNIAIAARHALTQHGVQRILIVDFDVHHGNGTQEVFYASPDVLYFSTHEWPFYPGSGDLSETGSGAGRGYTVNVPLPGRCGDAEYAEVYRQLLPPLARRFNPELIMVSAGFDPHWADPLANMRLSVSGFRGILSIVRGLAVELCQGKLVLTLEGGYNVQALASAIASLLYLLNGDDTIVDPLGPARTAGSPPDVQPIISRIRSLHKLGG